MCSQETLIGYLLDALEPAERLVVEQELGRSPSLQAELQQLRLMLRPLEHEPAVTASAPRGLASKTCELVAERDCSAALAVATGDQSSEWDSAPWRLTDCVAAIGVVFAASLLFFPALLQSKYNASLARCEENMRQLYLAMAQYAETYSGDLPSLDPRAELAFAGMSPVLMVSTGHLDAERFRPCPGSDPLQLQAKELVARLVERHVRCEKDKQLLVLFKRIPDGYAYNVGRLEGGRYIPLRWEFSSGTPVLADAPSNHWEGSPSSNHGGLVYNVMFQDGRIRRQSVKSQLPDDLYRSERGLVEIPQSETDHVLGGSVWKLALPESNLIAETFLPVSSRGLPNSSSQFMRDALPVGNASPAIDSLPFANGMLRGEFAWPQELLGNSGEWAGERHQLD